MPIYEYECGACGHKLETIQKMSDAPLTDCPHCHKPELHKLVSAAGFQLKGTGWYVTDFKDKNKSAAPTQENSSKNKEDSSSGSSSNSSTSSGTT